MKENEIVVVVLPPEIEGAIDRVANNVFYHFTDSFNKEQLVKALRELVIEIIKTQSPKP